MKNQYYLTLILLAALLTSTFALFPKEPSEVIEDGATREDVSDDGDSEAERTLAPVSPQAATRPDLGEPVQARNVERRSIVFLKSGGGGLMGRVEIEVPRNGEHVQEALVEAGQVEADSR